MKYWYFAVLSIAFTLALILAEGKRKMTAALIFKALASASFVALGVFSFRMSSDRGKAVFLLLGLIFGAVGDVLLNVCHLVHESPQIFFIGGMSFFIGHIMYLFVLVPAAVPYVVPAVIAGVGVAVLLLIFLHRKQNADRILFLESVAYMITVSLMASFAVFGFFAKTGDPAGILRALGGVLFLVSDTMLFCRMIRKEKAPAALGALLLIAYYPAQCLIAFSMQFM